MFRYKKDRKKGILLNLSLVSIICSLSCIFLISTLLQKLIVIPVNQLIGSLLLIALLLVQLAPRTTMRFVTLLVYFTVPIVITLLMTGDLPLAIIEIMRYISFFLFFCFIIRSDILKEMKEYVYRNQLFLKFILLLANAIILFCLFQSDCYSYQWGSEPYFTGYTAFYHTMASACCLLIAISMLYIQQKERVRIYRVAYILIPSIALFYTGARTFLFSLVILMIIFVKTNIKRSNYRKLTYLIAASIGTYIFFSSSMIEKFSFAANNKYVSSSMDSFTSGRNDLWEVAINSFIHDNMIFRFLGRGFTYSYSINEKATGHYLWSHSDIFNILVCGGLLGLGAYSYIVFKACRNLFIMGKQKYKYILFLLYVMLPAILNGFYEYQHYVISAMFLYVYLSIDFDKHLTVKDQV
ncbi:O-antigen ligase family protein [Priestia aryabhattai]|uniref:O-antigen ligase family protein n=1 Tax=Priestia aryabhattai TaxID=412384 RepID=UPI001C0D90F8|nr:O-antigen ligase family protein [Priestia aryabhattai]MBU3570696.1 O-antigen ligase family protein [Priestia aryabhattai]